MGTIAGDYNRQHSVNRRKSPAIAGDHAEAYRRVMSTWPSLMVGTAEGDLPKLFSLNKGDLSLIFIQRHRLNYFNHTHAHARTHACARVRALARVRVHARARVCVRVRACLRARVRLLVRACACVRACAYACACMHVRVLARACARVCDFACARALARVCVCVIKVV